MTNWRALLEEAGRPLLANDLVSMAARPSLEYNLCLSELHALSRAGTIFRWRGPSGQWTFSLTASPSVVPIDAETKPDPGLPIDFREPPLWDETCGPVFGVWTYCLPYARNSRRGPVPGSYCGWTARWAGAAGQAFPCVPVEKMDRASLFWELSDAAAYGFHGAGRLLLEFGRDPGTRDGVVRPEIERWLREWRSAYPEAVAAWCVPPGVLHLTKRKDWWPSMRPDWQIERTRGGVWTLVTETGTFPLAGVPEMRDISGTEKRFAAAATRAANTIRMDGTRPTVIPPFGSDNE
ncbi:MAG: hypothetical protein ABIJ57_03680 [Pseudomonadota bacterium]